MSSHVDSSTVEIRGDVTPDVGTVVIGEVEGSELEGVVVESYWDHVVITWENGLTDTYEDDVFATDEKGEEVTA